MKYSFWQVSWDSPSHMTSFVDPLWLKLRRLLRAAWNNNANTFTECFCEILRDLYAYPAVSFILCCSVMVAVCTSPLVVAEIVSPLLQCIRLRPWRVSGWHSRKGFLCTSCSNGDAEATEANGLSKTTRLGILDLTVPFTHPCHLQYQWDSPTADPF